MGLYFCAQLFNPSDTIVFVHVEVHVGLMCLIRLLNPSDKVVFVQGAGVGKLCFIHYLICHFVCFVLFRGRGRELLPRAGRRAISLRWPSGGMRAPRGKGLHTRNQHLRNHCGFSVAVSNGCSVAFSNIISLVSDRFQRIVTCPVDFDWNCPMDCQWHFPVKFHFCDFWCVRPIPLLTLWVSGGLTQVPS